MSDEGAKLDSSELFCFWYCPTCGLKVEPEMVTYEETHDARYGGCGGEVHPITHKDIQDTMPERP